MGEFLMSMKNVSLAFGGPCVLDNVTLSIDRGMRAALTGRNGEGKSTLLKVMAGDLEADTGEIVRAAGLKTVYVSQSVPADIPGDDEFNALSGGKRRRRILEEAFLSKCDLLLLDEPTNHLDMEAIDWLEGMIRRMRDATVILVTHDRRFLKRVAERIFDLDRGELSGWECDYSTFLKRKAELMADEAVYWERKTKKLAEEEAWIRRGVKARTTRNEGRVEALRKLRLEVASRRSAQGSVSMRLDTAAPGGESVLKIKNLKFSYPGTDKDIVKDFTTTILRGERIGLLGLNGAGKTTLLKLLTGLLEPVSGSVVRGTNVKLALFDQLRDGIKEELTVAANLASDRDEVVVGGVRKHVYSYLSDFLFSSERARTPVKALSGGERARLMLAKLFLEPANLLVMDEPTNDLDIETLELLEEQLLAYGGTLLLVSHDRDFLDNVVTSTIVLDGEGNVREFPGGYEDFIRQSGGGFAAKRKAEVKAEVKPKVESPSQPKKRLSYNEKRELETLPEKIDSLEKRIAEILQSDPIKCRDDYAQVPEIQAELDRCIERWAELESIAEGG